MIQVGNQILELQKVSAEFTYHNLASEWAESGDKVNKMFFKIHNYHKSMARISQ